MNFTVRMLTPGVRDLNNVEFVGHVQNPFLGYPSVRLNKKAGESVVSNSFKVGESASGSVEVRGRWVLLFTISRLDDISNHKLFQLEVRLYQSR